MTLSDLAQQAWNGPCQALIGSLREHNQMTPSDVMIHRTCMGAIVVASLFWNELSGHGKDLEFSVLMAHRDTNECLLKPLNIPLKYCDWEPSADLPMVIPD